MSDKRITELSLASTLDTTDLLPVVNTSETKKTTVSILTKEVRDSVTPITGSGFLVSGDILPNRPSGVSIGSSENPFKEIFLRSGSINIASGMPGAPDTVLSNEEGNILISAGGMQLIGAGAFNAATGSFQYLSGSLEYIGQMTVDGDISFNGDHAIVTASLDSSTLSFTKTDSTTFGIDLTTSFVKKAYGQFYDTTTQSGSANTAYVVKHNTTDISFGVIVSGSGALQVTEAGVYSLVTSLQFVKENSGSDEITVWFRKNGVDISDSATGLELKGSGYKDVFVMNIYLDLNVNDKIEVIWSSSTNNTKIAYVTGLTNPTRPAIPSVITTLQKIG